MTSEYYAYGNICFAVRDERLIKAKKGNFVYEKYSCVCSRIRKRRLNTVLEDR